MGRNYALLTRGEQVHRVIENSGWSEEPVNMLDEFIVARGESTSRATVGGQFRSQLRSLVDDTLKNCFCQFVRCIKPNKQKALHISI